MRRPSGSSHLFVHVSRLSRADRLSPSELRLRHSRSELGHFLSQRLVGGDENRDLLELCDGRGRGLSERRRVQLAKSRDRRLTHTPIGVLKPSDARVRVLSERRRVQLAKSRDRLLTHT